MSCRTSDRPIAGVEPPIASQVRGLAFVVVGKVMDSMLGPNRVIANDVNNCTYCRYVRCSTLQVWEGEMPSYQIGATHYHKQLGLLDKGRAIKEFVVFYVLWLGSMEEMGLRTCTSCAGLVSCCVVSGWMAMELKYRNTHIET